MHTMHNAYYMNVNIGTGIKLIAQPHGKTYSFVRL